MRKKEDYVISCLSRSNWFVYRKNTYMYLFRDGKFRDWHRMLDLYGSEHTNAETGFRSKSAASRALNKYLKAGK